MNMHQFRYGRRHFLARMLALAGASHLGAGLVASADAAVQEAATVRMQAGIPSATAQSAAAYRAVHQVLDYPRVLDDPLALPILGREALADLQSTVDRQSRSMRATIAMRSRYAEDRLATAVGRGVRQYVVLGAGRDTFAYRNVHAGRGLRVFEVDHPATQRWKRQRLQEAAIPVPASASFVPVDLETESLAERLRAAGLRENLPVFFAVLGVVIYISKPALLTTLDFVRSCATGSEIVFEFALPHASLSEQEYASRARSMASMAALGEPWVSFYEPIALADEMRGLGFKATDLLSTEAANQRYFTGRSDRLRMAGSTHMLAART